MKLVRDKMRKEPVPAFGEVDPMSWAAMKTGINLCGAVNPDDEHSARCTRAAGHDESNDARHVATAFLTCVTLSVWEAHP